MKLSCTPISFRNHFTKQGMTLETYIARCAELGCSGIDLLSTNYYPWIWNDIASEKKQLAGWLANSGLVLAAYGCGNNFCHASQQERDVEIEKVHEAILEAAELGAPVMRIFGGHIEPDRLEAGLGAHIGMPLVIEGIDRCLPMAEKYGVTLALENHNNMPGHSHEIASIIEMFDSPRLRCMFDVANFMGNSMDEVEDPMRALDRLLPYVVHAHVKDVGPPQFFKDRRAEAYVTGQGKTPVRQFMARLDQSCYQGFCSLEYEASFKVSEEEGVPQSLAYLRGVGKLHQSLRRQTAVVR